MTYNEQDLVVRYAKEKGGGEDGQLVIDDVELSETSDNRIRHGIGQQDPTSIEQGNKTYTFSATTMLNDAQVRALKRIDNGEARASSVYVLHTDSDGTITYKEQAEGMVTNDVTRQASDDGDVSVSIDADLFGLELSGSASEL